MRSKFTCTFFLPVIAMVCFSTQIIYAENLATLFHQLEKLSLQRHGYTLGAGLNKDQLEIARANPLESSTKGTFKFHDKTLFIVAQEKSNRILVIYERIEAAELPKIKDIIGDLYITFDEPTVMAHDKIVYWAYTSKGKISQEKFNSAKKAKKPLNILATIKCVSDLKFMDEASTDKTGDIYYIISSDPVLKQLYL